MKVVSTTNVTRIASFLFNLSPPPKLSNSSPERLFEAAGSNMLSLDKYDGMKDVLEYRCVQNWLLGLEPTTTRSYVVPFREFCMQSQKSPDDILRDAKADKTEFHYSLKKYWRNLQQHGVGASTRTKGYFTVRSFLF